MIDQTEIENIKFRINAAGFAVTDGRGQAQNKVHLITIGYRDAHLGFYQITR